MQKKYLLLGGGMLGLAALAAAAVVLVVVLFVLFGGTLFGGTGQRDLGVGSDPMLFSSMLEEEGVTLTNDASEYCLTCDITYSNPGPMDATLSSEELTSYLQATNNQKGPVKDIQVKLLDDNRMEASAKVDLSEYGYDYSGPVYAKGRIEKASERTVNFEVEEASAGPLPHTTPPAPHTVGPVRGPIGKTRFQTDPPAGCAARGGQTAEWHGCRADCGRAPIRCRPPWRRGPIRRGARNRRRPAR